MSLFAIDFYGQQDYGMIKLRATKLGTIVRYTCTKQTMDFRSGPMNQPGIRCTKMGTLDTNYYI